MSQDKTGSNWRDALDRYETPLDAERFFAGLEPHLPQPEKKRRRAAFWWQRLLPLAGLLLAGMWFLWPDNAVEEGSDAVVGTESLQHVTPAIVELNEEQDKEAIVSPVESSDSEAFAHKRKGANAKSAFAPGKTSTHLESITAIKTPTPFHHHEEGVIPPTITSAALRSSESISSSSLFEEADPTFNRQDNLVEQKERAIPPHNNMEDLPLLPGILNSLESKEEAASSQRVLPPLALSKSRKAWQLHLDMMSGVGYPSRSVMATKLENAAFLTTRRSTETMIGAWNAGVDLRLYTPVGLFLQSGVRYHNITERFDWSTSEEDYRYDFVEGMLLESNGQLTPYQDSAWHRISSTRLVKHYNHIRTWDIPVALGYRHVWGPLSGDVAIGLQINLKQSAEGRSLNLQGSPTYWNDEDALRYRNRIDMGAMLQGRLVWHPTPVYGIFIQPVLHLQPGSRTDEAVAGYKMQYHTFYLQAGVSLRLF